MATGSKYMINHQVLNMLNQIHACSVRIKMAHIQILITNGISL